MMNCQVPWCERAALDELPEELRDADVGLCDVHVDYLTTRAEEARATEFPESYAEHIILRELQALLFPEEAAPQLHALSGGAS
jgi:hypothetical protein